MNYKTLPYKLRTDMHFRIVINPEIMRLVNEAMFPIGSLVTSIEGIIYDEVEGILYEKSY